MSNPSVFELLNETINGNNVTIEDNIGEAIHVHFGNLRLDLTVQEFFNIAEQLKEVLREIVILPNDDIANYDYNFVLKYYDCWRYITKIQNCMINTQTLKICCADEGNIKKYVPIKESVYYNYYLSGNTIVDTYENENFIFERNSERADYILNIIKKSSLDSFKEPIVIDSDGIVLDGEKRISALCYLQGDADIAVKRFYFPANMHFGKPKKILKRKW